jgi:PBSX family phage terminase large subunit
MARVLSLNNCFPEPPNGGKRGPLPKQLEFLTKALDLKGPKYIRYLGGIGSGKTLIGCVTVLAWAVQYPGDYLIGRYYFPELRDTTLKTFLEICPKDLIIEHRVADAIVRVKCAGGGISNILFRATEEPDKLRSLNLNGFYLDESCQTSEEGFLLLQGRLRGKYVRKGIMTTNSDGRSWGWRYFVQKSMFNDPEVGKLFHNISAPTMENEHLPLDYVQTALATWSELRIRRELYGEEDAFEGAIYPEFRRDVHVIKPFSIPKEWTRVIGADHGYSNPAAFIWGAVDYDGNIYIYREYYETQRLVHEICKEVEAANADEKIEGIYLDPSTKAVRSQTGRSDWEVYLEHLPSKFALLTAENDVTSGIDRVKTYLKPSVRTGKPKLFIFDTCHNVLDEIGEYRWAPLSPGMQGKANEKEQPRKYKDHAMDALRYLVMSRPELPQVADRMAEMRNVASVEGSLRRELHAKRNPVVTDPFQDF